MLIDDLIATGGTILAGIELIKQQGVRRSSSSSSSDELSTGGVGVYPVMVVMVMMMLELHI